MKIFNKMALFACLSYWVLILVLCSLHFPWIIIVSLVWPFCLGLIMLGVAWQGEEDEANKVTDKKRFPPLPSDIQEEYEYWRND